MRIVIASDIHGSEKFCRELINCYAQENGDRLLLLGDILYHGPRNELPELYKPRCVIDMLNEMREELICVKGNCDSEVDQMVLDFPILAEYCLLQEEKTMIFATHGHQFNVENPPNLKRGDILLHGHTHIPAKEMFDGKYYLNPGSISIPKAGSGHSYMVLENGIFTWKTLEGLEFDSYCIQK